jgi:hypothetical protein
MSAVINDSLRLAIAYSLRLGGFACSGLQQLRLQRFASKQERLKRKYRSLNADKNRRGTFAYTSGSAGVPKRILYSSKRLRAVKFVFSDMFVRACHPFYLKRTSLYVFSSFEPDQSLTSLLLYETGVPNYLSTLQTPYRVEQHPLIRALAAEYGPTAVRLWLITLSNPGVLYSTNPSTLSTFFDELNHHWHESSSLIRDWCNYPKRFNPTVHKIARRLASRGSAQCLLMIAASNRPIPIALFAPALEAYICWTGGYVKPFLDRLQQHLPAPRYRLIPMYSMSTETIETTTHFTNNNDICFLPLAPNVVYEFLVAGSAQPRLVEPKDLEPGKLYEMIVTDAYGLRRYRTSDLFLCRRKINDLPDLAFVRRRGLEYSFTGEKLTAEQVSLVFAQLRTQYPNVFGADFLTCIPSETTNTLPHYTVLVLGNNNQGHDLAEPAIRCEELLCEVNCEYRSKRASGRLGRVRIIETSAKEFAVRFSAHGAWESQFKFLPLCPHLIWRDESHVS